MDKQTAIDKIKKCLALSKSSNQNEAAAALRQARALMDKFGVSDHDVLASEIAEATAQAGAKTSPPGYEAHLALSVGEAFGCHVLFLRGYRASHWTFIGDATSAEVASYAFVVLRRQLLKERAVFVKAECKRLKPANKTRRADLFCDAWVWAVADQVKRFASPPTNEAGVAAYLESHYASSKTLATRDRNEDRALKDKDYDAVHAGRQAGSKAQLNRGVGGASTPALTHH